MIYEEGIIVNVGFCSLVPQGGGSDKICTNLHQEAGFPSNVNPIS
jgi:hypothetical protein